MNDKRAKVVRRLARRMCDASITKMHVRSFKKSSAVVAKDDEGEPILKDGKPIELVPARINYTAFWPTNSYRRIIRECKDGKPAGFPVPKEAS